jgi:hypothetical protein
MNRKLPVKREGLLPNPCGVLREQRLRETLSLLRLFALRSGKGFAKRFFDDSHSVCSPSFGALSKNNVSVVKPREGKSVKA